MFGRLQAVFMVIELPANAIDFCQYVITNQLIILYYIRYAISFLCCCVDFVRERNYRPTVKKLEDRDAEISDANVVD